MPGTPASSAGNEEETYWAFWRWRDVWSVAKIIRLTLNARAAQTLQHAQRSEGAPILFPRVRLCFQLPVVLSKGRRVCSEISRGLLRRSSSLSPIHKPDGSTFYSVSLCFFFVCFLCVVIWFCLLLLFLCSTPSTTPLLSSATCFSSLSASFIITLYFNLVAFPVQNPIKLLPDPDAAYWSGGEKIKNK